MADSESNNPSEEVTEPTLVSNALSSCLRNRNATAKHHPPNRSVSFPDDDSQIVTGYLEPANPWEYAESTNKEVVITSYKKSCEKHGTRPISSILDQLESMEFGGERVECLTLKGEPLVTASCEALEEILKRIQFVKLNLEATGLDDEAAVVLFDMIEYYEAATHLNISSNNSIGVTGWQACSRMLKRTKSLEHLECRNTALTEQYMPILNRALRLSTQLQVLKLENSSLSGRPMVILVAALKLNNGLKELYLAENYLDANDAMQLGALLKYNSSLQLLDISNNNIEDLGLGHLCDGLVEQSNPGLNILVVWNNRLTSKTSQHLSVTLSKNKTLEMLNIGQNQLGNFTLHSLKEAMLSNRSLLRLGMQSTQITCEGAIALAEIIADNPILQRIDLRDNNLEVAGLMALSHSMKINASITQLDLDDRPRSKHTAMESMGKYIELVDEIRGYCLRNDSSGGSKGGEEAKEKITQIASRKISLTCDTLMQQRASIAAGGHLLAEPRNRGGRLRSPAPSPIPSPVASPSPTRTRFQVSKVSEDSPPDTMFFGSSSRFKVTVVEADVVPKNNIKIGFDTKDSSEESLPSPESENAKASPSVAAETKPAETAAQEGATKCPTPGPPSQPGGGSKPNEGRTRKLSSWVAPASLFTENKAVERLLGLFQNPFGRHTPSQTEREPGLPDILNNNDGGECEVATWPQGRSPPSRPTSGSAPSLLVLLHGHSPPVGMISTWTSSLKWILEVPVSLLWKFMYYWNTSFS